MHFRISSAWRISHRTSGRSLRLNAEEIGMLLSGFVGGGAFFTGLSLPLMEESYEWRSSTTVLLVMLYSDGEIDECTFHYLKKFLVFSVLSSAIHS